MCYVLCCAVVLCIVPVHVLAHAQSIAQGLYQCKMGTAPGH
jgi:hypothetical protein